MRTLSFTLILLVVAVAAMSQTKNFIDQPYIEVTAQVDTSVTPDNIYMSITINEKDTRGKVSVEKLENKMIKELKKLGIDTEKQLTLLDVSSNFKKYFLKQKDVIKAKSYSLLVHTGLRAGEVIQTLERLNISNVQLSKMEYSKIDELKLTLKTRAVKKAAIIAKSLVEPLGQDVGKAIYISDQSVYNRSYAAAPVSFALKQPAADNGNYAPAEIEFEKIKVENTVSVKFVLE